MPKDVRPSSLGLRRIALLEDLTSARFDALARECRWRSFEAGEPVISRDAGDQDVYLIVSGRVRITTFSAAGRQVTFRDFGAGEHFGEVGAIDGMPRSADVVALEYSLLAMLTRSSFERLIREEPVVAGRLLRHLSVLVRRLSERVIDLSTLGVHQRLDAELLRLARESGVSGNCARIEPAPKHTDLASKISTYREQVSREISALVRAGILGKNGRALVVLDIARLEKMVEASRSSA